MALPDIPFNDPLFSRCEMSGGPGDYCQGSPNQPAEKNQTFQAERNREMKKGTVGLGGGGGVISLNEHLTALTQLMEHY